MKSMLALAKDEFKKMKRKKEREAEAAKVAEPASAAAAPSRPMGEMGRDELIEYLNNMGKKVEIKVDQLDESSRRLALRVNGGGLTLPSRKFDAYPVPDDENLPGGGWYGWSEIVKRNTSPENSSICIFSTTIWPTPDYGMNWGKFGKRLTREKLINDPKTKLRCYEINDDDKDEDGIVKQTFLLEKLVEWINDSDTEDSAAGAQSPGEQKRSESASSKGGRRKKKRTRTRRTRRTRRGGRRKTRRKRKTRKRKTRRKTKRKRR